jgi:N-acetylglucosamine malate deacetylase 1
VQKIKKKILVVAAHPDDEVIGCGGTIAKLKKQGNEIYVLFVSDGESSRNVKNLSSLILKRKKSAIRSSKILGIKKIFFCDLPDNNLDSISRLTIVKLIEKYIVDIKPQIVFTHFNGDLNIDHQIVSKSVITACRPQKKNPVKKLLFFEIPSSTDWQIGNKKNNVFNPNWFEDISKTRSLKIKALKAYKTEIRKWPHPRSIKGINSLMQVRGATAGFNFAEAFVLGRFKN